MRRRYRLNPCDYLFFAHDAMMQRCGQTGNLPFMSLDLEGPLDPARLEAAVDKAMQAHPVTRTRARVSILTGRPSWQRVERADAPAVVTYDLRNDANWQTTADQHCQDNYAAGWPIYRSPQVRLELYRGPDDQSRICLRWPHSLMDAEGAQWFMHEVNRLASDSPAPPPTALLADDAILDALGNRRFRERAALCRSRAAGVGGEKHFTMRGMTSDERPAGQWRFLHRNWPDSAWNQIRTNADKACTNGPARFSRFIGACVLRALHQLFVEHNMDVPTWQVTLPMRMRGVPTQRPMPGNYLVSVGLSATRDTVKDRARLLEDLGRQIELFYASKADLSNAALVWAMSFFRLSQYRGLLKWAMLKRQPYASGFSYYGEIDPPLRSLLGARVKNFWGGGTLSAPPGWNPVFSRFGDSLNLCLSWLDGYHRAATAHRFVDLIESELMSDAP